MAEVYRDVTLSDLREEIDRALKPDQRVDESLLIKVGAMRLPLFVAKRTIRQVANRAYPQLFTKYVREHPEYEGLYVASVAQVIVTQTVAPTEVEENETRTNGDANGGRDAAPTGPVSSAVHETEDNSESVNINLGALVDPELGWAAVHELLHRIDRIGQSASLWIHNRAERTPHLDRAYGLATVVIGSLERKIWRGWLHPELKSSAEDSEFASELEALDQETKLAEHSLEQAAEQSAQSVYAGGMAWGLLAIFVLSLVVGGVLWHYDVDAVTAIALPAGAIGAAVSVMQRMHAGKLDLEYQADRQRLLMFGAFRPFIGAIFGMAVYAVLAANQFPSLQIPNGTGPALAFVGLLGFVSGFNERFSQDLVSGVGKRISG